MTDVRNLSEAEMIETVIAIIDEVTSGAFTALLEPDVPALSAGIIDSLALAEVVDAIDARFGVHLGAEELGFDTADTPRQLAALVASHS